MNAAPHEGVCSTYCLKDRGSTFNLNHFTVCMDQKDETSPTKWKFDL